MVTMVVVVVVTVGAVAAVPATAQQINKREAVYVSRFNLYFMESCSFAKVRRGNAGLGEVHFSDRQRDH